MKRLITFLAFTLCCVTVFCSCKKTPSPQDLLVGTWQLTKTEMKMELGSTSADKTYVPETDTFIAFENNGNGRVFSLDNNRNFTYVFNDVISNLIMKYVNGGETSYIVDELTKKSLVLFSTSNSTVLGVTMSSASKSYYTRVE